MESRLSDVSRCRIEVRENLLISEGRDGFDGRALIGIAARIFPGCGQQIRRDRDVAGRGQFVGQTFRPIR
jgi:hypothetical protein